MDRTEDAQNMVEDYAEYWELEEDEKNKLTEAIYDIVESFYCHFDANMAENDLWSSIIQRYVDDIRNGYL